MRLKRALHQFYFERSQQDVSVLVYRRIVMMKFFSSAIFLTSILMGILAAVQRNYPLLWINLIVSLHTVHNIYLVKTVKSVEPVLIWATCGAGILLLLLFGVSQYHDNLYIWTILFPLYAVSINPLKVGTRFFTLFFVGILLLSVINPAYSGVGIVPFVRYLITLLLGFFFAHYMEQTSERQHEEIEANRRSLEEAHRDLQELTIRDSLTGLHNRRYLDDILPMAIGQCRRYGAELAVMMIDVDFFKKYNDHYGHQKGDEALRQVATVLQRAVRRETDYVCRYGGEEFTIVMNKSSADAVDACARRILAGFEQTTIEHIFGIDGRLSVSIGTATLDQIGHDTVESLFQRADRALYEAKRQGRNRLCKL